MTKRISTKKAKTASQASVVHDNRIGVQIGGDCSKVGEFIMQILNTPYTDEATKVAALQAFREISKVENVTVSDMDISNS